MEDGTFKESTILSIIKKQETVDNLPIEFKELVWEYGWGIVSAYIRAGIKSSKTIRHLIETTMNGSYETRERRNSTHMISQAGERMNKSLNELNLPANGQALVESLRRNGGVLFPMKPTELMIKASMDALQTEKYANLVVGKREKHRIRLTLAMEAAAENELSITGWCDNKP